MLTWRWQKTKLIFFLYLQHTLIKSKDPIQMLVLITESPGCLSIVPLKLQLLAIGILHEKETIHTSVYLLTMASRPVPRIVFRRLIHELNGVPVAWSWPSKVASGVCWNMTEAEAGSSKGCSSVESRSSKVISALAPAADKDRGSIVVFIRSYLAIVKREREKVINVNSRFQHYPFCGVWRCCFTRRVNEAHYRSYKLNFMDQCKVGNSVSQMIMMIRCLVDTQVPGYPFQIPLCF